MKKKIIIVVVVVFAVAFISTGITLLLINNDSTNGKKQTTKKEYEGNYEVVKEPVNEENTDSTGPVIYDFPKNDDATDTNNYKKNSDGTLSNTSEKLFGSHEKDGIVISELKINTQKDNKEMAELSAKVTNNTGHAVGNLGFYLTFKFSDGTESHPFTLEVQSIPAGGTVDAKTTCIDRVIDASDYSFTVHSYENNGMG